MSFADDLAFIDPNTIEQNGPKYVMGHWHNGDTKLAALGKTHVAYTGGVFVPEKYLDDDLALAPGWAKIELTFSGGNTDRGIACSAPMLAVTATTPHTRRPPRNPPPSHGCVNVPFRYLLAMRLAFWGSLGGSTAMGGIITKPVGIAMIDGAD